MKIRYLLTIFLFISGCSSGLETTSPTLSRQSTLLPVTATLDKPQPTVTLVPTLTPVSSHTISTPSQKNNSEITLELLRTNNGCNLPCWWGIFPNQTSWNDASDFLNLFSTIYERQPPSDWSVYDVRSPISKEFSELGVIKAVFAARDGVIKEIEVSGFNEKSYVLSSILLTYGIPSQVLVSSYSSDYGLPQNQVPLSIDLYYPQIGINVLYGTYAAVNNAQIKGCLENPHLFLWSPNEHNRTIDYILGWDKANISYMSIEEATGLDVKDFYEKYSNSANPPCLQTPTYLWPSQ